MAEGSSQEKTEQATPRQLQKARERGQVAVSKDLNSAVLLAIATTMLANLVPSAATAFANDVRGTWSLTVAGGPAVGTQMLPVLLHFLGHAALLVLPPMVVLAAAGGAVTFLQIGPVLTGEPFKPTLTKLNPLAGLKRMFASGKSYVDLPKSILKFAVVGAVCYVTLRDQLRTITAVANGDVAGIAQVILSLTTTIARRVVVIFLSLALIDVLYQRWQWKQELRMTKEQVKKEAKDSDGDPLLKSARQQQRDEIAFYEMMEGARSADVIVVNPTHIAIALQYDPDKNSTPRILAKGRGYIAQKLREIAKEEGIPIVRNVGLARALEELKVNTTVPEDLFDAVAEVLKWVEVVARSRGELTRWQRPKPD